MPFYWGWVTRPGATSRRFEVEAKSRAAARRKILEQEERAIGTKCPAKTRITMGECLFNFCDLHPPRKKPKK